jgi:hypothetical protein
MIWLIIIGLIGVVILGLLYFFTSEIPAKFRIELILFKENTPPK